MQTFNDCVVIDPNGDKVGTVKDVVSDNITLEPRWLVVDMGALKPSHYIPVAGVTHVADDQLAVRYTKETVKTAAKAHRAHVLSPEDDRELMEHYGLTN
jgi:hypothetical protein